MKREIKFRAWDGKKMLNQGVAYSSGEILDEFGDESMQFTGLKDKNGKEIYEGDVLVSDEDKEMMSEGVHFNDGSFYAWWKYRNPKRGQRKDAFLGGNLRQEQTSKSEIIGNIYENPELLNK